MRTEAVLCFRVSASRVGAVALFCESACPAGAVFGRRNNLPLDLPACFSVIVAALLRPKVSFGAASLFSGIVDPLSVLFLGFVAAAEAVAAVIASNSIVLSSIACDLGVLGSVSPISVGLVVFVDASVLLLYDRDRAGLDILSLSSTNGLRKV